MSFRQALVLGLTIGLLHLIVRQRVEKFILLNPETAYIDDVAVYVRPTINFLYNFRFGQPITKEELRNLPENIRLVVERYFESEGRCLNHEGIYPGNSVLIVPAVLVVHLFRLSPHAFAFLTFILPSFLSLILYPALYVIIAWLIGGSAKEKFVLYSLLFCAVFIPPYSNAAEHNNIFALASVALALAYMRYKSTRFILWSLLLAVLSFFMKYRHAPLIFCIPLILFLLRDRYRFRAFGLMLLAWLPMQVLWSWHVYRYTCRWSLTSPSDIFSVILCEGIDEYCFSPKEIYNYFRVYAGHLQAKLAIPHDVYYHPDGLIWYAKGYTYKGRPSQPFPTFILRDTMLYERYKQLFDFTYKERASITDQKMLVLYGKYFIAQARLLMLETDSKYPWLPIYRFSRVLWDNIFHPPVGGFPHESRGRYPGWIKEVYFVYTSVYVAVGYIMGFLAGIVVLWMWLRGRLQEGFLPYVTVLVICGWSLIGVSSLTGHSEWRYFFLSAPLLLMAGVLLFLTVLPRKNLSSQ